MPAPYRSGQALGWFGLNAASTATQQINAAANWSAYSFVADSARTLSTARIFVSAVAGTLGASDAVADLYDSTGASGAPGASIETGKTPSATITASGWYTFTGFATALTAGQTYWIVFRNVNGTPATNNCTFRTTALQNLHQTGSATRQFWTRATSTNSGSTWSVTSAGAAVLRVGYADGSFDGTPISAVAATAVGNGVYATREVGCKFTSPANAVLNVYGIAMFLPAKTGSPTGSPRFGLWTGTSPVNAGYTTIVPATALTTNQWLYSYFASPIAIQPSTVCRVTLAEDTQSDASGNRYNHNEFAWDTDADSLALAPWNGTGAVRTYFDGSSWTDTSGFAYGHALLLDPAGEFGSSGGGSGGYVIGG